MTMYLKKLTDIDELEYAFKKPVISAITTPRKVDKSLISVGISSTTYTDIIVISYPTFDGSERLSTIKKKIDNNNVLTNVEGMTLVMLPKMFTSGNAEILEEVCVLLKKAHIEDKFFKYELVVEMRCMIHKYAKTLTDITRLEGVIGLQKVCIALKQRDQHLVEQGAFKTALRVKKVLGLEQALLISDFTREELENEKLNR